MTFPPATYRSAKILAVITIIYNVMEGLVSVYFGLQDDTIALLGFGLDSFVEVISGIGILHMVLRMTRGTVEERDRFERTALRITGSAFYLLAVGLFIGVVLNILRGAVPDTTIVGVIVSTVSILTMWALMIAKLRVGRGLSSDPIIADAKCTRTCLQLSFVLLASSAVYALFGLKFIDELGSLGIAWIAFNEGREAFEKAENRSLACDCDDDD